MWYNNHGGWHNVSLEWVEAMLFNGPLLEFNMVGVCNTSSNHIMQVEQKLIDTLAKAFLTLEGDTCAHEST